ncbi:MAG: GNAT family N-acetyltransferase [Deltaproteobacteria bacterium]|nr:GNAT family N-acetyltransferase [Deltaproteobacteria bacterium]
MKTLHVDSRTRLRPVRRTDAKALFALTESNREHLRAWLPWLDAIRSEKDTETFIAACVERARQTGAFTALIEHEGRACGVAGYNWIDAANHACEIGYWLDRDHIGRGIMTGCCRALIAHAFDVVELNRVNIPAAVGNRRSRAVPERLGFTQEGVLRDAEWLYDHYVDHALYTLLRRDWEAPQAGQEEP